MSTQPQPPRGKSFGQHKGATRKMKKKDTDCLVHGEMYQKEAKYGRPGDSL